jgi:hypothetical protein
LASLSEKEVKMDQKRYPYEVWKAEMEWLNEEAALLGKPRWITRRSEKTKDLSRIFLAMAPENDPYWAGRPADQPLGEWFAEIHARRIGNERRHIRGCFYIATGEDPDPEGKAEPERWPAEFFGGVLVDKTDSKHWETFQLASKNARNMGLVDPTLIVDSRTPVHRYFRGAGSVEPYLEYVAPTLELPDGVSFTFPTFTEAEASLGGYNYPYNMVPSLVEVWIEKELDSEDRPIVADVCDRLGANVITGSGNMRMSQAYAALRRQQEAGGIPLRILFLSDFDDAGDHMAVSPARHMQFSMEELDPKPDVRLSHLALTEDQVREQNIPAKPPTTKDQERAARERYFSERTGNLGSVQLNALTDTGPRSVWFERMLTDSIEALRDPNLVTKWRETRAEAVALVQNEIQRLMRWPHRGLELIRDRFRQTASEGYEEERQAIADKRSQVRDLMREQAALEEDLRQKLAADLHPLRERAEAMLERAEMRIGRLDELELPTYEAEEPEGAAEGWLFDSRRGYVEQQRWYNNRKFGTPIEIDED